MTDVRASQVGVYALDANDSTLGVRAAQVGAYVLCTYPTDELVASQLGNNALGAAELSNGIFDLYGHQLGIYALCRGNTRRVLRAWTFTQDDHDFYVLNLGDDLTLVYDKLTQQWSQWKSPEYAYWRGADGCSWQGVNLCCDTESGVIWEIDAENRLDAGTTPITSIAVGGMTKRFRDNVPCFMAELAVSEGQPPSGIDAGEAHFQLRTYDGLNWYDHGNVASTAVGDDITVRWYGLGVMKASGQLFEITNTGYARRIDGLNIEVRDGRTN